MKMDALEAAHKALVADAAAWQAKADRVVLEGVDRAHAHAVVALTETLRRTPDGRKSLRHASHSRSYLAALADLDNSLASLVGPSVVSLEGLLRDARESAYRMAFASWLKLMPADVAIPAGSEPTQARIADMRGLVLHGMELRREISGRIDQARRDLLAVIEMSARKAGVDADRADYLGGWKSRTENTLRLACNVAISDAMVAIDSIAAVDAVRPEFRPNDEFTPGG